MQLSAFDAVENGFVLGFENQKLNPFDYRGKASVDLEIKEILVNIDEDGHLVKSYENYVVNPQETVCLISKERIVVPENHVAYVFLKNRLSQKGLLAFNTGIIDPGFEGPVSTVMTNLSREAIQLSCNGENSKFFRVVFHKMTFAGELTRNEKRIYSFADYRKYRVQDLKTFPIHFLDPNKIKNQVDKSLSEKAGIISGRRMAFLSLVLTALLAILPIMVSIGIQVSSEIISSDRIELNELKKEVEELKKVLNK